MFLADIQEESPMKTLGLVLKSQRKENIKTGQEQGAENYEPRYGPLPRKKPFSSALGFLKRYPRKKLKKSIVLSLAI